MTQREPAVFLRNVNLLVRDVDYARRFYEETLGLILDERRSALPAMLILQTPGGCTLSLKDATTEEPGKVTGPGDVELGFETKALDEVHAAMTSFGVKVTAIVEQGFGRTFDGLDPDGHHLVVYTLRQENR
ncbi:hypothetical protein GCM10022631_01500 [Deinococcus rubellus]|uniref:VOC family protein n=1 Tax=Deinococcus rubellus TaxID=1889240 RepID=A0ABY5YI34_9DEIO|nr:VOC family protein [Deinococcus rubellus]UWX64729.1 VOC family protein [Deinococcus rubellus]